MPSPYRASTGASTGAYTLPAAGEVRLAVYDVAGRLVRALVRGEQPAGSYEIGWDGRHQDGGQVAPGVYFLQLEAAGERRSSSVVMLR